MPLIRWLASAMQWANCKVFDNHRMKAALRVCFRGKTTALNASLSVRMYMGLMHVSSIYTYIYIVVFQVLNADTA